MSQIEVLEIIKNNPGITQACLVEKYMTDNKLNTRYTGAVSKWVRMLAKKKDVFRVVVSAKHGTTFKLYLKEDYVKLNR